MPPPSACHASHSQRPSVPGRVSPCRQVRRLGSVVTPPARHGRKASAMSDGTPVAGWLGCACAGIASRPLTNDGIVELFKDGGIDSKPSLTQYKPSRNGATLCSLNEHRAKINNDLFRQPDVVVHQSMPTNTKVISNAEYEAKVAAGGKLGLAYGVTTHSCQGTTHTAGVIGVLNREHDGLG